MILENTLYCPSCKKSFFTTKTANLLRLAYSIVPGAVVLYIMLTRNQIGVLSLVNLAILLGAFVIMVVAMVLIKKKLIKKSGECPRCRGRLVEK